MLPTEVPSPEMCARLPRRRSQVPSLMSASAASHAPRPAGAAPRGRRAPRRPAPQPMRQRRPAPRLRRRRRRARARRGAHVGAPARRKAKRAAPHRSGAALGQGTRPAARTHTHTHSALRPHPAPRSPTQRPGKSAPPSDCLSSEIDPHLLRDSVLPRQPVAPRRVWAWGPWTCRSTTRSNSARETRPQPSGWPQAARARRGS